MNEHDLKDLLETLYDTYNRKTYLHPDPLEFLHRYADRRDREIVGLVAACLAYGRVQQILKSVSFVLSVMGPSPFAYLKTVPVSAIDSHFRSFRHRFAGCNQIAALLRGIKGILTRQGSLYACFREGVKNNEPTLLNGLSRFVDQISAGAGCSPGHLLPLPERGSACKRLHLFLRWMVRTDEVDPGGWEDMGASKLIVPLDVHMHRIGRTLGFTKRNQADLRTALEITDGFRKIISADPVRYDFALTRLGIRKGLDLEKHLETFRFLLTHR